MFREKPFRKENPKSKSGARNASPKETDNRMKRFQQFVEKCGCPTRLSQQTKETNIVWIG
ncbi:MAG: hypothetical protein AB1656_23975 [Candidatus Omnitrophota bacterium]